ncbi:hypothetical protein [Pseudodonghicola flavimaris]|uniref:DUF1127 domain-containing protein n=1 Tax=Pseudodonghicola flavimaris TaxID=3050036 RepID=A0ABT7EV19_9RHOB|nr:hypothetical protein [Pseudodonghicola flavimaris]MDK3016187.1 hypothetical protein [Pseudodonghicola flavimaris]
MAVIVPFSPAPKGHLPAQIVRNASPSRLSRLMLWRQRRAQRLMLRDDLLRQPDSVLADAGWTRAAARAEAAKPFWRG